MTYMSFCTIFLYFFSRPGSITTRRLVVVVSKITSYLLTCICNYYYFFFWIFNFLLIPFRIFSVCQKYSLVPVYTRFLKNKKKRTTSIGVLFVKNCFLARFFEIHNRCQSTSVTAIKSNQLTTNAIGSGESRKIIIPFESFL